MQTKKCARCQKAKKELLEACKNCGSNSVYNKPNPSRLLKALKKVR